MKDKATILAVDDTPESLALLVKVLTPEGYQVRPADSGELALAAVAASLPDLILLDVRMKGLGGLEVCRRLKAAEETRHIPIILISAFADVKEWVEGLRLGAADYITKPFQPEELLTRVKTHLALNLANVSLEQQAAMLRQTNEQLQSEIGERRHAEDELHRNLGLAERSRRALLSALEDQKRVEAALRDVRWRLESIIEGAHVGTWEWDVQTGETVYNQVWAKILGYTLAEMAPINVKTWRIFIHPDDLKQSNEMLERHFAGELPYYDCEFRMKHKDGHWVWIHDRGRVITCTSDGKPQMVFGTHTDITERKRAEAQKEAALEEVRLKAKELQEKNEELDRFTYSVSHDLKSPLVTIRTFLGVLEQDMAARDTDKEKVKQDIDYIRIGAEKMSRLLDELLDLSRIGRSPNPAEEVSLQSIVKEACALVAGRITARGVKVVVAETEFMLRGDRVRLVEVFQNLLDNACKFMGEQKAPLVEIGVETKDGEAVIYVRDNGMGIPPQFLPKLFIMFEKLIRNSEGDGIGLALVKRIVEVHGGRIWAESFDPAQGTTFYFTLPKTSLQKTKDSQC